MSSGAGSTTSRGGTLRLLTVGTSRRAPASACKVKCMSTPLHRTIAAELRHRVRSGMLKVGESMPSESQLCDEFSASRGPVRQALATLREEGLISGGQGKRAVILDAVPTQPFESFLSFTRRAELTGYTPGQRLQEIALRRPEPEIAAALQIEPEDLAVQLVRLRLLDGRPAMLERMTYVESVGRPLISADLDSKLDLRSAHRTRGGPALCPPHVRCRGCGRSGRKAHGGSGRLSPPQGATPDYRLAGRPHRVVRRPLSSGCRHRYSHQQSQLPHRHALIQASPREPLMPACRHRGHSEPERPEPSGRAGPVPGVNSANLAVRPTPLPSTTPPSRTDRQHAWDQARRALSPPLRHYAT